MLITWTACWWGNLLLERDMAFSDVLHMGTHMHVGAVPRQKIKYTLWRVTNFFVCILYYAILSFRSCFPHTCSHCNHGKNGKDSQAQSIALCWHALILWGQLDAFALQWLSDLAWKTQIWSTDWVVFTLLTPGLCAPVNIGITGKC